MNVAFLIARVIAVIGLTGAAFTYLFSGRRATNLLQQIGILCLGLLLLPVLLEHLFDKSPLGLFTSLVLLSLIAYLLREHRRPAPPMRSRSSGPAERTPILPAKENEQ